MKTLFSAIFSFLLVSCSAASERQIDEITVHGAKLKIFSRNQSCVLVNNRSEIELAPTPSCYFLRTSNGAPQFYSYKDVGVDAVLIVSGTPVSEKVRKEWGLSANDMCGTVGQGILILGDKVLVTKEVLEGGVLCRDSGSDEKNYWHFAHTK